MTLSMSITLRRGDFAGLGVGRLFLGGVRADDVLDADHQAGLAGDGHAVGQPAGAAAHRLDEEVGAVGLGVGDQVADLAAEEVDGREIAEREVDAAVVVVDRLRQMDDGDPRRVGRQLLLIELELVGRLERVVAADRDQRVDADRAQCFVDRLERLDALGIVEVRRAGRRPCRGWCGRCR